MPVIDPNGIFDGDRINSCSVMAQLYYPRLLCASNGFGRIQINYLKIVAFAFPRWTKQQVPDEPSLLSYFQEYAHNRLIFVYESSGQIWGQWDAKKSTFGKYQTNEDKRSPEPPSEAFAKWQEANRKHSVKPSTAMAYFTLSSPAENLREISTNPPQGSEEFPRGIGVGKGDGIRYEVLGVGKQPSPDKIAIPPESDKKIKEIADAHPRLIKPAETYRAIIDQLENRLVNIHGSVDGAFQYLLSRTLLYAKKTQDWPPGERQFIVGSPNWFKEGCFDEDAALWAWDRSGAGNGSITSKADQRSADIRESTRRVFDAARSVLANDPGRLQEQALGRGTGVVDPGAVSGAGKILDAGDSGGAGRDGKKPALVRGPGS